MRVKKFNPDQALQDMEEIVRKEVDEQIVAKQKKKKRERNKKSKTLTGQSETAVQEKLVSYLRKHHSSVLFNADMAGVNLTMGQAVKARKAGAINSAHPDLVIYEPRIYNNRICSALFVELKKENAAVFKKNGELYKSEHLHKQNEYHKQLIKRGYEACFCAGYESAKNKIEKYLLSERLEENQYIQRLENELERERTEQAHALSSRI